MPNLDGGHYFLTVLAPVRTDTMIDPIVGRSRSHPHELAQKLALLPTGRQISTAPAEALPSPFAGNTQNHFVRLVIIDGPHFNGRVPVDALWAALRKIDPLAPQPVDSFGCPYLLFAAELDAQADGEGALDAYAQTLWKTMSKDLAEIFGHCVGFDGVGSAEGFLDYLRKCQVETTLPFNDYWADGLPAADGGLPLGPLLLTGALAAAAAVLWIAAMVANALMMLIGVHGGWLARAAAAGAAWGVVIVPVLLALAAVSAFWLYRWVMRRGAQPFAVAPGSDLPTILKALFLQQEFTRFVIEAQGLDDATLQRRFGAFVAAVRPDAPTPTQAPGGLQAPICGWPT